MLVVRRSEVRLNNKVEKGKFFIRDGSTEMILASNKKTVWFIQAPGISSIVFNMVLV